MNNKVIKIKKGLDLPVAGAAELRVVDSLGVDLYAVKPTDFVGFTPRLRVAEGDSVAAGQTLMVDKRDERLALPSPVDGTVEAIVRGEKRKLLAVVVRRQSASSASEAPASAVRQLTVESPVWWMIKERPFGTIANPDHKPKGIFVSMRDTNPLAADVDFALRGREHDFEAGVQALSQFAEVHCVRAEGPHPAGNIGTIVNKISPINKGEYIWTVGPQDVASIGHWMLTGQYRPLRVVAVAGPAAKAPHYYRMLCGASVKDICDTQMGSSNFPSLEAERSETRVISGSILSGTQIAPDDYLCAYDTQLSFLPEGNYYDFLGWIMPGLRKFSYSNTFLSGILTHFTPKCLRRDLNRQLSPAVDFDTNLHGAVRPLMFTGGFEQVMPLDIYPMQLLKACIVGDMELQEALGIYEVEPEDFALCEFIDPSKTEIQTTIREALEALRKEAIA